MLLLTPLFTLFLMNDYSDGYSLLPDGRIIDRSPMRKGKIPLVLEGKNWVPFFEGKIASIIEAQPLRNDVAKLLIELIISQG